MGTESNPGDVADLARLVPLSDGGASSSGGERGFGNQSRAPLADQALAHGDQDQRLIDNKTWQGSSSGFAGASRYELCFYTSSDCIYRRSVCCSTQLDVHTHPTGHRRIDLQLMYENISGSHPGNLRGEWRFSRQWWMRGDDDAAVDWIGL